MALGKRLPPRAGYAMARIITGIIDRFRHSSLYRTLYANQSVILGDGATPDRTRRAVRALLDHAGRCSYDFMHTLAGGEEAIPRSITWPAETWDNINRARSLGRGLVLVGAHCSNFNLAILSFALNHLPVQVLSLSKPVGGFRIMHELRNRGIVEETPIDPSALRAAIQRLRGGGTVVTVADWPLPGSEHERLSFFGKPAPVPNSHVRLAMNSNAVMLPMVCRWTPEQGYFIKTAPHMELELGGDRAADLRHNAQRVLAIFERWIAETPEQWLMYYRVWPDHAPVLHD